jgi:hypothetical protein
MIKGINTQGRYMQVQGGTATNYINNYSGAQGVGNMRYNTTNQNMEVYDGNSWQMLQMGYATVGLNYEAESLLDWARQERDRQMKREHLIENNPALQKAYEAIQRAEANFDILEKFVENDQSESESVQSSP